MPFIIGIDDFEIQIVGKFFRLNLVVVAFDKRYEARSAKREHIVFDGTEFAFGVGRKEVPHRRCLASPFFTFSFFSFIF